jgi:hypothetical protein
MKRLWAILVGITIASIFIEPAAAQTPAPGDNDAVCTFRFTEYFSPGVTLTPTSGTQNSGGEVGSMTCSGKLQGHNITGPGTFGNEGFLHESTCVLDHSTGRYFATLPTDAGPIRFEGTYSLLRTGLTLKVDTEQAGARGTGSAAVIPTRGDCVMTPVTEALVFMTLSFRDNTAPITRCDVDLGVVLANCRTRGPAA